MIFYGIRHKATGQLMPASKRRGYSHWNPATEAGSKAVFALHYPRLLETEKQAKQCIIQWYANPNASVSHTISYEGTEDNSIDIKPDGRKKEDLEVVKIKLLIQ